MNLISKPLTSVLTQDGLDLLELRFGRPVLPSHVVTAASVSKKRRQVQFAINGPKRLSYSAHVSVRHLKEAA